MSITVRSSLPGIVFCTGIVLFFLGWRKLGIVLAVAPIVLGLLVTLWALLSKPDE